MSTSLDRRRMLLDKVFQLCAQICVVASVMLDQIDNPMDHRLQTVNREERILSVLLDLVMPKLGVVIN